MEEPYKWFMIRELLDKDITCTIHERNIQLLAVECYKTFNNIGPTLLDEIYFSYQDTVDQN